MHDWQINVETLLAGKRSLARLSNMQEVPLFAYYVEAGLKRDGSASSTPMLTFVSAIVS
jgi:hypothetical protein